MKKLQTAVARIIFCVATITSISQAHAADDWPGWRGPNRDGKSDDVGLLKSWDGAPPLAWTAEGIGIGYSGVSIVDGRVFTMGERDGECQVIALSDENGDELWSRAVDKEWTQGGYHGPRCTPTYSDDRLYVVAPHGAIVCLDAKSGEEVWRRDFAEEYDGKMMSIWGFSESPLVDGDRVICTPGGPDAMLVALDKKTGDEIWKAAIPDLGERGKDGAGYSSIVVSNGGGVKQYVQLVGRGLIGVDAETGEFLWGYNRIANPTANIPTPIVRDDYVFTSTGYGTGSALLKLAPSSDGVRAEEVYFLQAKQLQNHHGGLVMIGDYLFCGRGHNNGFPTCVEFMTGEHQWPERLRGPGRKSAAVTYADGHLVFRYQDGVVALVPANPDKFEIAGEFEIPNVEKPSWPHPVIHNGHLYLREQDTLYVYDIRDNG